MEAEKYWSEKDEAEKYWSDKDNHAVKMYKNRKKVAIPIERNGYRRGRVEVERQSGGRDTEWSSGDGVEVERDRVELGET